MQTNTLGHQVLHPEDRRLRTGRYIARHEDGMGAEVFRVYTEF